MENLIRWHYIVVIKWEKRENGDSQYSKSNGWDFSPNYWKTWSLTFRKHWIPSRLNEKNTLHYNCKRRKRRANSSNNRSLWNNIFRVKGKCFERTILSPAKLLSSMKIKLREFATMFFCHGENFWSLYFRYKKLRERTSETWEERWRNK